MAPTDAPRRVSWVNPKENHDVEIISICTVFPFVSLAAIIARLISRRITHATLKLDDAFLVAAWAFASAQAVMLIYGAKHLGTGWHVTIVNDDQMVLLQKFHYATYFLQSSALSFAKLSILILLRRIFSISRGFRITVWILGGIVISWWIAITLGHALVCYPKGLVWEPSSKASCANEKLMNIIIPIIWVLTDFAILLCPIPLIKQLHLPRGKRAGLYAVFLMGSLTCIVSVIRYRVLFYPVGDITWDVVPHAIWNIIEAHVTIICATIIVCKPAFGLLFSFAPFSSVRSRFQGNHRSQNFEFLSRFAFPKDVSQSVRSLHENSMASSKPTQTSNELLIDTDRSFNSNNNEVA